MLLIESGSRDPVCASQILRSIVTDVTACYDAKSALEKFDRQAFDLIVVDLETPRMPGLDLIRSVRSRPDARRKTPIIALCTYSMEGHRLRIVSAGATGVVKKPLTDAAALSLEIANILGNQFTENRFEEESAVIVDSAIYRRLADTVGEEIVLELLHNLQADLKKAKHELTEAIAHNDADMFRRVSHILISVAGHFGAVPLESAARSLNAQAHKDDEKLLIKAAEKCLYEVGRAIEFFSERRRES